MKYQSSNTKIIHNIDFNGSKMHLCPECSHLRKKKNVKCLEYYQSDNRAYCFHCNTTYFEYKAKKEKEYIIPEWKNVTKLTDKAVKWFTGRKISQSILNKLKVYSDNEYMSQFDKEIEVICFPYFFNDKLINIKYRGPGKSFKLNSGSELIFYNLDAITNNEIIICEGEIDCLTFIENGFDNVISVPNGANNNPEYLDNYIELFTNKKIILSIDNDSKGLILKDELINRFGVENCKIIDFKECKDANEYLFKYDGIEFKNRVNEAKEIPIKGIIKVNDLYNDIYDLYKNGIQPGKKINCENIDEFIIWYLGLLCAVTGWPSSGKSEFVDYLITKLNLLYGWKAAFFTPENYPLKLHYAKLHEKICGKNFNKSEEIDFDNTFEFINNNFYYILDEDNQTIDKIISCAKSLIKNKGIKILVIDPYNAVEHNIDKSLTETRYINDFLGKLIKFTRFYNILTFLIAHPTKLQPGEIPTLYSISGSAHFYNKTDIGFTVDRRKDNNNLMGNDVDIYWQKIRFKHLGKQGKTELIYNYNNGRYEEKTDKGINDWDNYNWLIKDNFNEINTEFYEQGKDAPF